MCFRLCFSKVKLLCLNHSRSHLRSVSGMSLVEVLIAAGMLSIVALGFSNVIYNALLGGNSVKFRSDADNAVAEFRALLSSPAACLNSFGEKVVDVGSSHPITSLMDAASPAAPVYSVGSTYGDQSFVLNGMTLDKYVPGARPDTADMTLNVLFKTAKTATGPQIITRTVRISLTRDPINNKLTSCVALARMSDGIWQKSIANLNDIFYVPSSAPGGNVGVGTATPAARLDVKGGFIHGQFDCRYVMGPTQNAGSNAMCAADEFVLSGGGICERIAFGGAKDGFLHTSLPTSTLDGWMADCYTFDNNGDAAVTAYAICCKK